MEGKIMNRKFEIMTEDKNREGVRRIVQTHFSGFTIQMARDGFWRDEHEMSICITIIGTVADRESVKDIAIRIKSLNKQESVLVVISKVKAEFI